MRHTHVHELESSAASECRETFPGAEQASAVRARYGSVIFAANRHRRRRRRPSAGSASIDEHDEDTKFGVMSASEEPQEVKPAPPKERRFKLSRSVSADSFLDYFVLIICDNDRACDRCR